MKVPNPGDKCPRCKSGLVVRDEVGLACDECPWQMDIDEAVRRRETDVKSPGGFQFKAKKFSITVDDPEEAENFLRGLIVARSNNSSEYFVEMIEAVNVILEPYRKARLENEMLERAKAGMA